MKLWSAIAASMLMAAVLSGCGSDTDAYCDALEDMQEKYGSADVADLDNLDDVSSTFENLADEAPSEVEDDWQTLNDGVQDLKSALEDADIDTDDLDDLDLEDLRDQLDEDQLQNLVTSWQQLQSPEMKEAGENMADHAEEECDVELKQ